MNRWPLRKQCMRKPKSSLPTRSPLTHSTCISLSQERAPAKVEWTCPPQSTPLRRPRLNYIQRRSNVLLRLKHRLHIMYEVILLCYYCWAEVVTRQRHCYRLEAAALLQHTISRDGGVVLHCLLRCRRNAAARRPPSVEFISPSRAMAAVHLLAHDEHYITLELFILYTILYYIYCGLSKDNCKEHYDN